MPSSSLSSSSFVFCLSDVPVPFSVHFSLSPSPPPPSSCAMPTATCNQRNTSSFLLFPSNLHTKIASNLSAIKVIQCLQTAPPPLFPPSKHQRFSLYIYQYNSISHPSLSLLCMCVHACVCLRVPHHILTISVGLFTFQ